MSSITVSVEWVFGDVTNYYKFLDFRKNLKIQLSAVGKMYCVPFSRMRSYVFMEIQLLHSLIVTHRVDKNIFDSELNQSSASNFTELL